MVTRGNFTKVNVRFSEENLRFHRVTDFKSGKFTLGGVKGRFVPPGERTNEKVRFGEGEKVQCVIS